ncbi:Hsp20/alpha crystallin family protein [Spirochaeta thermophila]|uniref:Heat shock protein Hsp20 n=2 Tax=Winmispira thermophila TaxID=154 RepID=G0GCK3_WINT7|nr:Hsp20/alpha crystallin family protein [Spirochaeta thermophila]ADN02674.1 putative heat shock protein [Spirochaeta thermophila DSM 6192]AEJ62069.1 heat shock protein Hsp20 [Spirochaeta thermophila DSM 6578]
MARDLVRRTTDTWLDELDRIQEEINRVFDLVWPETTGLFDRVTSPSLDVMETDNEVIVSCDLPGVSEKDLDITLTNNVLTIKGEKKDEKEEKKGDYYRKESWSGAFQRTVSLPDSIDPDAVKAELKNGVLTITIAKREEKKPKKIAVQVK